MLRGCSQKCVLLVPEAAEGQGVRHTGHLVLQLPLDRDLRGSVLQGEPGDGRRLWEEKGRGQSLFGEFQAE